MAKIARGLLVGVALFLVVGVVLPYLLDYASGFLSNYVTLPRPSERWLILLGLGGLFGATAFLQNAYSKGEYPWLFGRIGSGLTSMGFYYFVFLLLPGGGGSGGGNLGLGVAVDATGLLLLVYLGIVLSYGYIVLDFFDYRHRKREASKAS